MNKAVLISIRPKWCELIASGEKTIEVRKTRPKIETPFKCYIYCTKPSFEYEDFIALDNGRFIFGGGKVIGEFACDRVFDIEFDEDEGYNETYTPLGFHDCLTDEEFDRYLGAKDGSGWHISDLVIYDEPKQLSEFYRWYDGTTDIRPCENGKPCEHLIFDYSEDHEACGIDYDGENCPFLKVSRPPQSYCYVEELP